MLTTLRIKNLALVDDLLLELQPGYNVITGETGAGKSILIGALSLVLGERADRSLIRAGSESCSVEAVFDSSRLAAAVEDLLKENGLEPCQEHQLILKRSFTSAGANRQFVNGSPTTLSSLAELGQWLVDIHGPHDHQSLLHPSRQQAILDAFGDLDQQRQGFADLVRRRAALEQRKGDLIIDDRTYAQQLDLLRFQTREIAAAQLQPGEDVQIEQEYTRASNASRLLQLSQEASNLLSESETCLLNQTAGLGRTLHQLRRLDPTAERLVEVHEQTVALLQELQTGLSTYADQVELDPARLQQLEERLNLLQSLKRKYGPSLSEVLAFGQDVNNQLSSLEQREQQLAVINEQLKRLATEIFAAGQALSAKRRQLVPQLGKAVTRQLADLGFQQSRFEVQLSSLEPSEFGPQLDRVSLQGLDTMEFQFAPNPGEPIRPLRAIASSGELARVMLALKTVLAATDEIPVLVFDEVDANVGGETARVIGDKMRQIARKRQVICISHLPQVAAAASAHFLVTKEVRAGRTISLIGLLDKKERVTELARMLGGQTAPARKHAEALLAEV